MRSLRFLLQAYFSPRAPPVLHVPIRAKLIFLLSYCTKHAFFLPTCELSPHSYGTYVLILLLRSPFVSLRHPRMRHYAGRVHNSALLASATVDILGFLSIFIPQIVSPGLQQYLFVLPPYAFQSMTFVSQTSSPLRPRLFLLNMYESPIRLLHGELLLLRPSLNAQRLFSSRPEGGTPAGNIIHSGKATPPRWATS